MDDLLELENRRKIYNLIQKNPGLHLSKIAEILKMRVSHVEYHLLYLEKNQLISAEKEIGYTRYYVRGKVGSTDKKILSVIRRKIPLIIILFLIKKEKAQHKQILEYLDIAPSTLSYHLKKLIDAGIITIENIQEKKIYSVVNKKELVGILLRYKPYSVIEGFKDVWSDLRVD